MIKKITFYPSKAENGSGGYLQNISNIVGKGLNNTQTATMYKISSNDENVTCFICFDTSSIPEDAIIKSVKFGVNGKLVMTTGADCKSSYITLYVGDKYMSRGFTYLPNSQEKDLNNAYSGWTYENLQNAKIRWTVSYNDGAAVGEADKIYLYGAELVVEYEVRDYTVSVENNSSVETNPVGEQNVSKGESFSLKIIGEVGSITDNGANVKNDLKDGGGSEADEILSHVTEITTEDTIKGSSNYKSVIGKDTRNAVPGNVYSSKSGVTATIKYSFDFSELPENAIIDVVEVKVGGHLENTTKSLTQGMKLQLYSGENEKGDSACFSKTSHEVITMPTAEWTREELQSAYLLFTFGYYGGLIGGVDFNVTYYLPSDGAKRYVYTIPAVTEDHLIVIGGDEEQVTPLRIKTDGVWKQIKKIYCKEGGTYTEKTVDEMPTDCKYKMIT